MDGTGELFAPLLLELGEEFPTIVVRYPDRPAGYAAHEAVAAAAIPKDQPYILLAESFSGPIAISLASAASTQLVGIILCASFVTCPRALLAWMRPLISLAPSQRVPASISTPLLMGRFVTPSLRALYTVAISQVSGHTLSSRLEAIASVDVQEQLKHVRAPSLYLRATEDHLVPASAATEFVRHAPLSMLVEIEAPHLLLQINAQAAAVAIRNFVAKICGS